MLLLLLLAFFSYARLCCASLDSSCACSGPLIDCAQMHENKGRFCEAEDAFCDGGWDEALMMCEDPTWLSSECLESSQIRCGGRRPGQCFEKSHVCDGIYHCIDRSDEASCPHDNGRSSPPDTHATLVTMITVIIVALGTPMVWALKFRLTRFAILHWSKKAAPERPLLENVTIEPAISKFLLAAKALVDDQEAEPSPELEECYRSVHALERGWKTMLIDLAPLLFDSDPAQIDAYFVLIHRLECAVHAGSERSTNLCLKGSFGNRRVKSILWSSEPPCIRTVYKAVFPPFLHRLIRTMTFEVVSLLLSLATDLLSYYLDFFKDWTILFVAYASLRPTQFSSLSGQLIMLMVAFLVVPEVLKGAYFSRNYRKIFDGLADLQLSRSGRFVLSASVMLLSPVVPAVILVNKCLNSLAVLKQRRLLVSDLTTGVMIRHLDCYSELCRKGRILDAMIVQAKRTEMTLETFFQYILQLVILCLATESRNFGVSGSVARLFFSVGSTWLIAASIALGLVSLISTRTAIESSKKKGFLPDLGKVTFGAHVLASLLAKTVAILAYFAPLLGILGFSEHWHFGRMPFANNDWIVDANVTTTLTLRDAWLPIVEGHEAFIGLPTRVMYLLFLCLLVPVQICGLYALKVRFCPSFSQKASLVGRLLHVTDCLIFPDIVSDWDVAHTGQDYEAYRTAWRRRVVPELWLMHAWHVLWNAIYILPLIAVAGPSVLQRHSALTKLRGFSPLPGEEFAHHLVLTAVIAAPLAVLLILPLVQLMAIFLYYKFGHPWCRLSEYF